MRISRSQVIAFAVFLAAWAAESTARAQSAPDPKGWHGATWGMTGEQLAAATGLELTTGVPFDPATIQRDEARTHSRSPLRDLRIWRVGGVAVGRWLVLAEFTVHDARGLVSISLAFAPAASYRSIRDDLVATYGPPFSEHTEWFEDGTIDRPPEARWLLPMTDIRCEASAGRGKGTHVYYARRAASVLNP